ncbi:MAG: tetraacyldisaccharide 4'-kinase [Bacteroidales bacterium]|nr:tetraacyldisaccharide 4'-kinase [Bacteroidales bacterium]
MKNDTRQIIKYARYLLFPLSWFYGGFMTIRRWLYNSGVLPAQTLPVPSIGIGNLRVGGTGKTPHTEYVLKLLASHYYNTALISRGYGRKNKQIQVANALPPSKQTSENLGDEPYQLYQKFPNTIVVVAKNRLLGFRAMQAYNTRTEVVVFDDVYQHLSVTPGMQILLTEYGDPYFHDYPFPAGNLREFSSAAKNAHCIIVTKCPTTLSLQKATLLRDKLHLRHGQACFFTTYRYLPPNPCNDAARQTLLLPDTPVLLLTAIARPTPLYQHLRSVFHDIEHLKFQDHHHLTPKDMTRVSSLLTAGYRQKVLITTEKDFARGFSFDKEHEKIPLFTVGIEVAFLFHEEELFNQKMIEYVRENTKNSPFSG